MIDTHAHLQDSDFDSDRHSIIQSFSKLGIQKVICIGTNRQSSLDAISLSKEYDSILATVGLHPHYCIGDVDLSWMKQTIQSHRVVAVGECGLDYHYDNIDKLAQKRAFEHQIQLAQAVNLPLIVHMRDATDDTVQILSSYKLTDGAVMHCFGGDESLALRFVDMGFYISFSGNVTFKKATDIQSAAKAVPLDRLLIETDSPYLAPVPHRGKRNDSTNVRFVAQFISDLRQIPLQDLVQATTNNAQILFGI